MESWMLARVIIYLKHNFLTIIAVTQLLLVRNRNLPLSLDSSVGLGTDSLEPLCSVKQHSCCPLSLGVRSWSFGRSHRIINFRIRYFRQGPSQASSVDNSSVVVSESLRDLILDFA